VYRANGDDDFIPRAKSQESITADLTTMGLKEIEIEEMECKDGKMPVQLFTSSKNAWGQGKQVQRCRRRHPTVPAIPDPDVLSGRAATHPCHPPRLRQILPGVQEVVQRVSTKGACGG